MVFTSFVRKLQSPLSNISTRLFAALKPVLSPTYQEFWWAKKNLWYHQSQSLGLNCMFLLYIWHFEVASKVVISLSESTSYPICFISKVISLLTTTNYDIWNISWFQIQGIMLNPISHFLWFFSTNNTTIPTRYMLRCIFSWHTRPTSLYPPPQQRTCLSILAK